VGGLLGSSTRPVMFHLNGASRSTILNAKKTFVGIGFAIVAAHRFEVLGTNFIASLECECGQTPFQWHYEHVPAAILLSHVTFGTIEFVVGAAHEAGRFGIAGGIAVSGGGTVGKGDGNDACAACSLFHFAQRTVDVAIGTAYRSGQFVVIVAFLSGALEIA